MTTKGATAMMEHDATDDSLSLVPAEVFARAKPLTAPTRSVARVEADARAAAIVRDAIGGRPSATDAALASRFGVCESRVAALRKGIAPYHLGDVLLMPTAEGLLVLDALRSHIAEAAPALPVGTRVHRITMSHGELAGAVLAAQADGKWDANEVRDVTQKTLAVAKDAHLLMRDVAAEAGSR